MISQGFDSETEILTSERWVTGRDLDKTDLVASYDIQKDTLGFETALDLWNEEYEGPMFFYSNRGTSIHLPPGQVILYKLLSRSSPWHLDCIGNIGWNRTRVWFKTSSSSTRGACAIADDEIRACAWLIADGYYSCTKTKHILRSTGVTVRYPSITPKITQRLSKAHLISDILEHLGWPYSKSIRHRKITHICGRKLLVPPEPECTFSIKKPAADRLMSLVPDKHRIPAWGFGLNNEQFLAFLTSYIDADGSRHPSAPGSSWMIYGTKVILEDIQRACITHGYRASLSIYRHKEYRLNITPNEWTCIDDYRNAMSIRNYSGKLWCVATPRHTTVIRRNGRVLIIGDCSHNA